MTPAEQREAVIERDEGQCFARLTLPAHKSCTNRYGGTCTPPDMECAHLYPKSWMTNRIASLRLHGPTDSPLLRAAEDQIVYDPRNAVAMCPGAHHSWDYGGKRCFLEELPLHFFDFLDAYERRYWAREIYSMRPEDSEPTDWEVW